MSNLRLRLKMYGDEAIGTTFVIGNVFPVDRSAPQNLRKSLRDLSIPAGDEPDRWASVPVPPGKYEIQVSMPSGEMMTRDVEIEAGTDEPVEVTFEAPSPHEWLAAQYFQGNVGGRDRRRSDDKDWIVQSFNLGSTDSVSLESITRSRRMGTPDLLGTIPDIPSEVIWCPDSMPVAPTEIIWDTLYKIISDNLSSADTTEQFLDRPMHGLVQPVTPVFDSDSVRTYRFSLNGPLALGETKPVDQDFLGGEPPPRCYVLVRNDEDTRLVIAPVPWFDLLDYNREVAFELMSPLGSVGVTTAVRDTAMGSIIGYMTNNSIHQARLLVNQAEGMLFHKYSNPLGAAAGAYVMLMTENDRTKVSWHAWIKNLHRNFRWIPDGAIAYAMLKLNHQQTDEDVDEALEATLAACDRGIPFYSMGMRFLLDTLTEFAEDEVFSHRRDEIKHRLKQVRVVARRTNFQQPFTSIQISRRNR